MLSFNMIWVNFLLLLSVGISGGEGWFSLLSIVIFFSYAISFSFRDTAFFWLSLYFIFALSTSVLFSFFIERGAYLWEINEYGRATGLTVRAGFYSFLILAGAHVGFKTIQKTNVGFYSFTNKSSQGIIFLIYSVVIVFSIILVLISIKYGAPWQLEMHRADYWSYHAPSWGRVVNYWLTQMALPLGLIFADRKVKAPIILFFILLFAIVLMGERFTGVLMSSFFFFLPILILKSISLTRIVCSIKGIVLTALFIAFVVYLVYKSYSGNNIWQQIQGRAVVQSQMWWALDNLSELIPRGIDKIIYNFFGFFTEKTENGIYFLMALVAPPEIVANRIETSSTFTMGGVFGTVYFFGYLLGSIVNWLLGMVFGFSCSLLYKTIVSGNFLAAIIALKIFQKFMTILLMGEISLFFSLQTFVFLVVLSFFVKFKKAEGESKCV